MLEGRIWRMKFLSNVTDTWLDVGGYFWLSRTPTHSPPYVKTERTSLAMQASAFGRIHFMLFCGFGFLLG
jgi:hypothetical protein